MSENLHTLDRNEIVDLKDAGGKIQKGKMLGDKENTN